VFEGSNKDIIIYIEDNHTFLQKGSVGNCIPDFKFKASDEKEYTVDTKTSINVLDKCSTPMGLCKVTESFHKADYVCMFCMTTHKFY
jgi:hypothetical protein